MSNGFEEDTEALIAIWQERKESVGTRLGEEARQYEEIQTEREDNHEARTRLEDTLREYEELQDALKALESALAFYRKQRTPAGVY